MARFPLSQLTAASHSRVANSPFLAAPTCTLTPVRNSASKSPAPLSQITSWLWARLARAARTKRKNNSSEAAKRRNRTGARCARSDGRQCVFFGAGGWQIFAMVQITGSCPIKKLEDDQTPIGLLFKKPARSEPQHLRGIPAEDRFLLCIAQK